MNLILASASPRRKELLGKLHLPFTVIVSDCDETLPADIPVTKAAEMLARRKARAVAEQHPDAIVIGADTTVILGNDILGKPRDYADCCRMLTALSGKTHQVITGVAIIEHGVEHGFSECTDVTFHALSEAEIIAYANSDEPYDKAGAYGIQGDGALLVSGICGDYCNVVGLPVSRLARELRKIIRLRQGQSFSVCD